MEDIHNKTYELVSTNWYVTDSYQLVGTNWYVTDSYQLVGTNS